MSLPLIDLVTLLWTCSKDRCPSCAWEPRAQGSTAGGVSSESSREAESLPLACRSFLFWCPGHNWVSGLQQHIASSCTTSHPPAASRQGCSQSVNFPACIDTRGYPDPGLGSRTWPCCNVTCHYKDVFAEKGSILLKEKNVFLSDSKTKWSKCNLSPECSRLHDFAEKYS